jgi:hypothetical protein
MPLSAITDCCRCLPLAPALCLCHADAVNLAVRFGAAIYVNKEVRVVQCMCFAAKQMQAQAGIRWRACKGSCL